MIRVTVLATVLSCEVLLNPTIAREGRKPAPVPSPRAEPTIISTRPDFADIDLRNKLESTTEAGIRRARRIKALYAADEAMTSNPKFRGIDQEARTAFYNRYLDAADGAPMIPLTGGVLELTVKEILGKSRQAAVLASKWLSKPSNGSSGSTPNGKAGDIADLVLPSQNFLNGAATLSLQALENLSRPQQQNLEPSQVYFLNNLFDATETKKYDGVLSRLNEGEMAYPASVHPKVALTRMYEKQIKAGVSLDQLQSSATAQGKRLELAIALQTSGNQNQEKILALMNSEIVPMLNETREQVKFASQYAFNEMKKQDLAVRRDQYTDPLNTIAGIAMLAGDYRVAKQAQGLATISGAAFDLAHMAGSFQSQPFKTVNLYLLIGTTALDLFQGAKGDPQAAAIMEALRGLSTQIEEFRVQMHERFDRLEMLQAHYFNQTFLDLDQIESSQTSIRRAVENLQSDLKDLKLTLTAGLDALAQDRFRGLNGHCFGDGQGAATALPNAREATLCFGAYLAYASGSLRNLTRVGDANSDDSIWPGLAATISQATGMPPIPAYDVNQFIHGTSRFAALMRRNQKWASIGRTETFSDMNQSYSLPLLIAEGRATERFYREMALQPAGDRYVLRNDLFDKLLSDYYRQIVEVTSSTQASYAGVLRDWPDPARKWELRPTESAASSSTLVNAPVTLCTPNGAIGVRTVRFLGRGMDGNPGAKVTEFNTNGMNMTKDFASFLPPAVRWGDYFGALDRDVAKPFSNFRLSACFTQADMDLVQITRPSKKGKGADHSHVHATLGIHLTATYTLRDGTPKSLVVTRLEGHPKEDGTMFFDPNYSPGLLNMMWTGAEAEDTQKHERRILLKRGGIRGNPKDYLAAVQVPWIQANVRELEKDLGSVFDSRKQDLFRVAMSTSGVAGKRLDVLRAQILYLVREGIDLSDDKAMAFYQKLVNGLPTNEAYLRWAIEISADRALDKFATQFKAILKSVDDLDREAGLQPAPSRLAGSLDVLEGIESTETPASAASERGQPATSKSRSSRGPIPLP